MESVKNIARDQQDWPSYDNEMEVSGLYSRIKSSEGFLVYMKYKYNVNYLLILW